MKVFISWSGTTSLKIAKVFREWLPSVIQSIEPYVSSEDIDKGARWSTDIAKELENSSFGILCVTKENIEAPWLSFEAGALSKAMDKSFVIPFLFDIKRIEVQGPILQFQSAIFEKDDIKRMVKTLNKACEKGGIPDDRLQNTFDVWYPQLEKQLKKIDENQDESTKETDPKIYTDKMLEEVLLLTRENRKLLTEPNNKLYENIDKIAKMIKEILAGKNYYNEQKEMRKRYDSLMLEEIMQMFNEGDPNSFLMLLSICKEDLPWIYAMGKETVELIKSNVSTAEKERAILSLKNMIDFSFNHPLTREFLGRERDNVIFFRQYPYTLIDRLDRLMRHLNRL